MAFCMKCGITIPDEDLLCPDCAAKGTSEEYGEQTSGFDVPDMSLHDSEAEAPEISEEQDVPEIPSEAGDTGETPSYPETNGTYFSENLPAENVPLIPPAESFGGEYDGQGGYGEYGNPVNEQEEFVQETVYPEYIDNSAYVEGGAAARSDKKIIWLVSGLSAAVLLIVAVIILFITHVFCIHDWMDATCEEPMICSRCEREKGEPNGHEWGNPDCTHPKTCSVCNAEMGNALGHSWTAASCLEAKTCTRCGEATGAALGHDWEEASCLAPKTCIRCGETTGEKGSHEWKAATCTSPKKCKVCGEKSGKAKGHKWQAATCTKAKTCKTCKKTDGEPKGHSWRSATCQSPKTCTTCGETSGGIGGHNWSPATIYSPMTCKTCGMTSGYSLDYYYVGYGYVDVDAGSTLLLREGMAEGTTTLASIPDGAEIAIWDCGVPGWYYSTYEGKYGYVKSAYVFFDYFYDDYYDYYW